VQGRHDLKIVLAAAAFVAVGLVHSNAYAQSNPMRQLTSLFGL
jgi:hypothetical protein